MATETKRCVSDVVKDIEEAKASVERLRPKANEASRLLREAETCLANLRIEFTRVVADDLDVSTVDDVLRTRRPQPAGR
jgi:signal transduction histidine kinase